MKVGIIGLFYNCEEFLPQVLEPWFEFKQKRLPLLITAINAQFKEYAELGYTNDDEPTRELLQTYAPQFNFLHIAKEPLTEAEARNVCLEYLLKEKVDVVWILDGDEIYTKEQIVGILQYIEKTPQFDYYHIYFDNRVFGMKSLDNFAPPRIFRTDRHGGIAGFDFDNTISYADGTDIYNWTPGFVPKKIAHVLHYTWNKKDAVDKINFHRKHYGFCPFTYDSDTQAFGIDESYFKLHHLPLPTIRDGYIEQARRKPANVVLTLGNEMEKANAVMVLTFETLLSLERENKYEIRLTIIAKRSFHESIHVLTDLLPFETVVVESLSSTEKNADTLYLDAHNLDKTTKEILAGVRKYFEPVSKQV